MKLYLNNKLESIPILNQLVTLLAEFYVGNLQSSIKSVEDIKEVRHLYDPVRNFIEYYGSGANIQLSEDRINYIVNSLYMSKGSQRIFDMLEELLEVKIDYRFDFPQIEIIQFENLKVTNVPQFVTKLTSALYYLVYYTDIVIKFNELVLSLQGNLISYHTGSVFCYKIHDVTANRGLIVSEDNFITTDGTVDKIYRI